jgi:hypothetical protein
MHRPVRLSDLVISLFLAGVAHSASTQRCDLVSQAPRCLDLSTTNGANLQVPSNTTRIPVAGLVLCGVPGSLPQATDIVYAVDQTASMVPQAIYTSAEDTSGFYDCNAGRNATSPALTYSGNLADFHGNPVKIIDNTQWTLAQVKSVCSIAGDPYSVRSSTVQAALQSQSTKEPGSYAATIGFGPGIQNTQDSMTQLPAGLAALQATVPLAALSGTNYEAALIWARILLYGGHSGSRVIPPSADPNKAIVIISDGRPTAGTWQNYYKAQDTVVQGGLVWRTDDSVHIPPVYGIYLGLDSIEGSVLKALADSTKGEYHIIPPNMPDSLALVIQQILGRLVKPAKPDTLLIQNQTNGQTSISTVFDTVGVGFRMRLDSLIGLQPGANQVTLTLKEKGRQVTANWTVQVTDATTGTTKGLDSMLTERCGSPSLLTLSPDRSGLPWADTADRNVLIGLKAFPEGDRSLPVRLTTVGSADLEKAGATVPSTAALDSMGTFGGSIPWQSLAASGAVPGDLVLRSGPGWDTAVGWFQMPRDPRDTASARLALHHVPTATLAMSASVMGPSGQVSVAVTDPDATASTLQVVVRHRLGDTLAVTLVRGADATYRGTFPFAQGTALDLSDSVLELGAAGTGNDSLTGSYKNLAAQTLVQPASLRLRFVDDQNGVHDSLGFDLAVGAQTHVRVQLWTGNTFCSSCGGLVDIVPSDPGLQIATTAGTATTSMRLVGGEFTILVQGVRPVVSAQILFHSDSIGVDLTARPVRVLPPSPDSVEYLDSDGDGRLDRARVFMPAGSPWAVGMEVQLPWPDSTRWLPVRTATIGFSPDTLVVTWDLDPQGTDTTTWAYPLQAHWRWNASAPWKAVAVKERIAPVPTRATLARGASYDTLRIWASEALWPSFTPLDALVGRKAGSTDSAVVPHSARLETATGALMLVIPSDSTNFYVHVGDSVRFLPGLKDLLGNAPGAVAKHVVVSGGDPAPRDAVILDSDADGRADRVVLRLRTPFAGTDTVGILWPDTDGVLRERKVPLAAAKTDSGGLRVTLDLDPFDFGATSCPAAGCQNLGYLASRAGGGAHVPFAVRDGVDPIPLQARYAFSAVAAIPDTLVVWLSEPIDTAGAGPWVSTGRPSLDSLGKAVRILADTAQVGVSRRIARHVWITDGNRRIRILLDGTFAGKVGDSLRISSSTVSGAVSDAAKNKPDTLAWWTPLDFGAPPPYMDASVPHPVVKLGGGVAPSGEPALATLVHPASAPDQWLALDGLTPAGLDGRFGGVLLRLNRIPDQLGLYVYDNMGVPVLSRDITGLARAASEGRLVRSGRGDYEVWLAWDGKDATGRTVGSGVYYLRIHGLLHEGSEVRMLNGVLPQGFKRDVPPPW